MSAASFPSSPREIAWLIRCNRCSAFSNTFKRALHSYGSKHWQPLQTQFGC
jgi:hypothetical protein